MVVGCYLYGNCQKYQYVLLELFFGCHYKIVVYMYTDSGVFLPITNDTKKSDFLKII